jgi:hypothetical protein
MRQIALTCSIAALLAATPALAADLNGGLKSKPSTPFVSSSLSPLSGFYIAGGAGFSALSLSHIDTAFDTSAQGIVLLGRIGFDHQFSGGPLAGVFVEGNWTNANVSSNTYNAGLGYGVGVRVGYPVGFTLPYLNGGWAWQDFSKVTGYTPNGPFVGAGIEFPVGPHLTFAPEVRGTWANDSTGGTKVNDTVLSAQGVLSYHF